MVIPSVATWGKKWTSDKFEIFENHGQQGDKPKVKDERIPEEGIALPEVSPQTVFFYVEEPPKGKATRQAK